MKEMCRGGAGNSQGVGGCNSGHPASNLLFAPAGLFTSARPTGLVKKASTSYLLSLLVKVKDCTAPSGFPLRTASFKLVDCRGAPSAFFR